MPARSRHAKPKSRASTFGPLAAAAATLAGVAAAFVFLQGGPADAGPSHPASVLSSANRQSGLAGNLMAAAIHRAASAAQTRMAVQRARAAARRRHLARAARRHARQPPAPTQVPSPPPQPGGDAAHSALGICIRSAEEGGSYAWGPGNGGGAYQFLLSTWEKYGGAASEDRGGRAAHPDPQIHNPNAPRGRRERAEHRRGWPSATGAPP